MNCLVIPLRPARAGFEAEHGQALTVQPGPVRGALESRDASVQGLQTLERIGDLTDMIVEKARGRMNGEDAHPSALCASRGRETPERNGK